MFSLFRSAKSLLFHAAVKARHAELAFRDAWRSMRGSRQALQELHEILGDRTPKPLAKRLYRTMRKVERHAKILRRHTITMRKHLEHLEHQARTRSR